MPWGFGSQGSGLGFRASLSFVLTWFWAPEPRARLVACYVHGGGGGYAGFYALPLALVLKWHVCLSDCETLELSTINLSLKPAVRIVSISRGRPAGEARTIAMTAMNDALAVLQIPADCARDRV